MKKIIIGLLMLMGITGVKAQESEYVPLVREGVQWVYAYYLGRGYYGDEYTFYTDELKGDTIIGDYSFKKLYRRFSKELDVSNTYPYAYMREADKRVYAVLNSQNNIGDYNLYRTGGLVIPSENYDAIGEYIIYDFNDMETLYNHSMMSSHSDEYLQFVFGLGDTIINNRLLKTYELTQYHNGMRIIESIGGDCTGGLLRPIKVSYVNCPCPETVGLSHVIENDEIVYKGCRYDRLHEMVGVREITIDSVNPANEIYYNLLGEPLSTTKPTTPGIYIKGCKKLVIK